MKKSKKVYKKKYKQKHLGNKINNQQQVIIWNYFTIQKNNRMIVKKKTQNIINNKFYHKLKIIHFNKMIFLCLISNYFYIK